MRGIFCDFESYDLVAWLTPVCTGKIYIENLGKSTEEAHPRIRGEDVPTMPNATFVLGSPPHMRGK